MVCFFAPAIPCSKGLIYYRDLKFHFSTETSKFLFFYRDFKYFSYYRGLVLTRVFPWCVSSCAQIRVPATTCARTAARTCFCMCVCIYICIYICMYIYIYDIQQQLARELQHVRVSVEKKNLHHKQLARSRQTQTQTQRQRASKNSKNSLSLSLSLSHSLTPSLPHPHYHTPPLLPAASGMETNKMIEKTTCYASLGIRSRV